MCSSAGSTPAVADMRTRLAHGRLAELHPKRVIALAVGEPIRVPYLKLYDDGYYRPRSPTGRGQCHTDSGFGRAVWRCPLTFRPHISQWSGSGSRLDSPRFPGATARETVRTLRVQGERRRLMASLSTGRGGTSGEGSSRAMMAGMRRPFSCTIATLPFGQTLPGNAMNDGAVAAPPPWHRLRICPLRPS